MTPSSDFKPREQDGIYHVYYTSSPEPAHFVDFDNFFSVALFKHELRTGGEELLISGQKEREGWL